VCLAALCWSLLLFLPLSVSLDRLTFDQPGSHLRKEWNKLYPNLTEEDTTRKDEQHQKTFQSDLFHKTSLRSSHGAKQYAECGKCQSHDNEK